MRFPELLSLDSLINISAKINHKGVLTVFRTSEAPWVQREIFHIILTGIRILQPFGLSFLSYRAIWSSSRRDRPPNSKTSRSERPSRKLFSYLPSIHLPVDFNDHPSFLCYPGFQKYPFRLINTTSKEQTLLWSSTTFLSTKTSFSQKQKSRAESAITL